MSKTAFCRDCGAAIRFRSRWCRKCGPRHRKEGSDRTCVDCGVPTFHVNSCCAPCANLRRRRTNVCQECGGRVSGRTVRRCRPCSDRRGVTFKVCPDCGGPKGIEATRCINCDRARRRSGLMDWRGVVLPFDADAFRDELNRSELEWSVGQLSAASGVSVSAIHHWLSKASKPCRPELEAVAAVLAFERCPACKGFGYLDPGKPGMQAVLDRVAKAHLSLKIIRPLTERPVSGDGWTLDPDKLEVAIGGTVLRVTKQESKLIGALASGRGSTVPVTQLAVVLGVSEQAVRTYVNRLRDKCTAAGSDFGAVVQNVSGAGYRAVMRTAQEATA